MQLFNIPNYTIDTSTFTHSLHGDVVSEFEKEFAQYVGCKYALAVSSATNAIQVLSNTYFKGVTFTIPSCIPRVVPNALIQGGSFIQFNDNVDWVGSDYVLHKGYTHNVIDSAHRVDRNQFERYGDNDVVIYSTYPTKPVGSLDGGLICSNDKEKMDELRTLVYNGMDMTADSWDRRQTKIGFKYYMGSFQAAIALENLRKLDAKKERLAEIRRQYNMAFGIDNTSDHLYRIKVMDNKSFIAKAKMLGITCGIHYEAAHLDPIFKGYKELPKSVESGRTTASIPFHEALTDGDVETVIKFVFGNA